MEFGYFSFFKKHKIHGRISMCIFFNNVFQKALREYLKRVIFFGRRQETKALNEINGTHQAICFLLRHVSMGYNPPTPAAKIKGQILATFKRKFYMTSDFSQTWI